MLPANLAGHFSEAVVTDAAGFGGQAMLRAVIRIVRSSADRLQCRPEKDYMLVVSGQITARVSRAPSPAFRAAAIRPLHQRKGPTR